MKFSKKGFTLIELLVVIAIIGILAAIVFVNVSSARDKARDAAVKANMASFPAAAEMIYDGEGSSYAKVCDSGKDSKKAYDAALKAIGGTDGTDGHCDAAVNTYVVCVRLATDKTKAWCIDSASAKREIPLVDCVTGATVCPASL